MNEARRSVSWPILAVATAVVALGLFMRGQTSCTSGNPNLAALEFEVDGVDQLNWVSGVDQYQVTMSSPTAILRAQTEDPNAEIRYQWWDGTTYLGMWTLGTEYVEAEIVIPGEDRLLRVDVRAPGGRRGYTNIEITNGYEYECTEAGIRQAIANGGGPHMFDCQGPTTVVTQAEIVIDNDVILYGEGELTVDGGGEHVDPLDDHCVFSVTSGVTAELRGFTVTGGRVVSMPGGGIRDAGGISNAGTLTLANSTVFGNTSIGLIGAGGIDNLGTLTLTNSTVSGNSATPDPKDGGAGGGISNNDTVTLIGSTVSGNTTSTGGGGIFNSGAMTLTSSTVSGNICSSGFGGGGILVNGGSVTLTNSTVSGNTGDGAGGIIISTSVGSVTLTNSTVSGNVGEIAGGISTFGGTATLTSNIVSNNSDPNCYGELESGGYNVESPGNTCGLVYNDLPGVTAEELNLGPLADNGGPTLTHALLTEPTVSAAIDRIPETRCEVETDQRGEPRPVAIRGPQPWCDVGAFERQLP